MNKIVLFSLLFLAQNAFSQVSVVKNKLVKDGQTYKMRQYTEVFKNPEAVTNFKLAKTNRTIADVLAITGGIGMGFTLGQIITSPKEGRLPDPFGGYVVFKTDNSARWTVFAASAGLAVISIPLYISSQKNSDKALQLENGEATAFQPYFKVETAGNSLALSYNF